MLISRQIAYSKDAQRTLRKIPANTAKRIMAKIAQFASDPKSLSNNVKTLTGTDDLIRLRVGDWRVIMNDDGTVLLILKIGPRGGVYD